MKALDDIRAKYPLLGLALYAFEPGKPVTLEIIVADQQPFTFVAATEAEAVALAFPADDEPTPPPSNVFD